MLAGYTTGDANISNWTANGMMCPTSRYLTLSADSQRVTDSAVIIESRTNSGSAAMDRVGAMPNQTINAAMTKKDMKKSTKGEITAAKGTIRRGKYTFLIRSELATRLPPPLVTAWAKYVQGSKPVKAKMEYGSPSEGIFEKYPNTRVKINIAQSG